MALPLSRVISNNQPYTDRIVPALGSRLAVAGDERESLAVYPCLSGIFVAQDSRNRAVQKSRPRGRCQAA